MFVFAVSTSRSEMGFKMEIIRFTPKELELLRSAVIEQQNVGHADEANAYAEIGKKIKTELTQIKCLADDLSELESLREERRWRVIGEEWPEGGNEYPHDRIECQLWRPGMDYCHILQWSHYCKIWSDDYETVDMNGNRIWAALHTSESVVYTHWRPTATDKPR